MSDNRKSSNTLHNPQKSYRTSRGAIKSERKNVRTLTTKDFFYAKVADFSANYLLGVINIIWSVFLMLFILTLFTIVATMFDAPADNASQIDLLIACLNFAVGIWLSGNGVFNEQILHNFNYILLGCTLLNMLIIYVVFRKINKPSRRSIVISSLVYALIVFGIYALNNHSGGINLLTHLPLPFLVAFVGIIFASYQGQTFSRLQKLLKTSRILIQIPRYVILSLRGALICVALILIISAVTMFFALIRSTHATESIFVSLNSSPFTAISVSTLTLSFLPNLCVYACSIIFFGTLTLGGDGNLFPPFPSVASLLRLEDMRNMHNIFPTVSFLVLILIFMLVNMWQMFLNGNETLFNALDRRRLLSSIVGYYTLTVFVTIMLVFISFAFLGYVSSGSLGNTVPWVGVDPLQFGLGFLQPALIAALISIMIFTIRKLQNPEQLNVILKTVVIKSTHSANEDVDVLRKKTTGGRNVSSTRQHK